MNIITISREFGSGGRELGKRLSDRLSCDYYDSEIISAVAQTSGMDAAYIENVLNNHRWKSQVPTFRRTFSSKSYVQNSQISLLLEQKKVIETIAEMGRDCVIVGRNADVILRDYRTFNIFVCASQEAKLKRCMERASESEKLTEKELLSRMKQIDRVRSQTRELMSGSAWGQREAYHITVNTTEWNMKELALAIADFAACWFGRNL